MVVLPLDSGPKISTTRPFGNPPTPSAASNEMQPVEIDCTPAVSIRSPRRMMDPLPNCFSICVKAMSIALFLLTRSSAITLSLPMIVNCRSSMYLMPDAQNEQQNFV